MFDRLSKEEIEAFREMAATFAGRSVAPMLAHESSDGDTERLPGILEQGAGAGLLAGAGRGDPGRDTGIWGANTLSQGPLVSALLLEELAVACAGVAMCFHARGLGALPIIRAENPPEVPPENVAWAFSECFGVPGLETLRSPGVGDPAEVSTIATEAAGGYEISGGKAFVYFCQRPSAYAVFSRLDKDGGWGCFLVPSDAKGLKIEDAGHRAGLRAAGLEHLEFQSVRLSEDSLLEFSDTTRDVLFEQLTYNMLGLCAIATGTARGALASARQYALERYQGGKQIIEHPAIQMLLAESDSRIAACRAGIASACTAQGYAESRFIKAVRAKLSIMPAAAGAVTDCLQVFGGYGYMEDYGIEKRLRDVSVLKSAGGAPRELRRILGQRIKEG